MQHKTYVVPEVGDDVIITKEFEGIHPFKVGDKVKVAEMGVATQPGSFIVAEGGHVVPRNCFELPKPKPGRDFNIYISVGFKMDTTVAGVTQMFDDAIFSSVPGASSWGVHVEKDVDFQKLKTYKKVLQNLMKALPITIHPIAEYQEAFKLLGGLKDDESSAETSSGAAPSENGAP